MINFNYRMHKPTFLQFADMLTRFYKAFGNDFDHIVDHHNIRNFIFKIIIKKTKILSRPVKNKHVAFSININEMLTMIKFFNILRQHLTATQYEFIILLSMHNDFCRMMTNSETLLFTLIPSDI